MGVLSQFNCLKITAPKRPRVSQSNTTVRASQSIYETVEGSHEYMIKGYSLAKGMGVGKSMTSAKFTVGGYDWVIDFYPDGDHVAIHEEYVSMVIELVSPGEVRAAYELKLLDQSGKGIHSVHKTRAPRTFNSKNNANIEIWGKQHHIKRYEFETSGYLKNDCLIIHCIVGVLQTRVEKGEHHVIHVPPSDMIQNLKGLLESEIGSDITLKVGNECFRAHKLILAARSPVFRAQFFGLVGNQDKETVVIDECDPFAFKAMLLFLYSDEIPETHELSNSNSLCASTIMMQHLLAAADRFGLARLKLMCEEKLCEEITADTVATTLVLAEQHRCLQLKTICLNFAAKLENLGEVMKSDGYAYLEKIYPSLLVDHLKASATIYKNEYQ